MSVGPEQSTNPAIPIPAEPGELPPYPASFIDRIMQSIRRLPIPYGLSYLALFILQALIFHVFAWIDGWVPRFTLNSLILVFPLWLWGPLAIMTYLNSTALEALTSFQSLLDIHPKELQRLKYEFSITPARDMILSSVIWSVIYGIIIYTTYQTVFTAEGITGWQSTIIIVEGLISFSIGSAVYYHSFRQLRLVNRTMKRVSHYDLFNLDPVYSFSVLTARTGIAWVILISLNLLFYPITLAPVPLFTLLVLQIIVVVAVFFLPLQIVNQRLVAEKRRLLAENSRRIEALLARLHQSLDSSQLPEYNLLGAAVTGLNTEHNILAQIPTWPWRTDLLSRFLSVAVLPILLFILQTLLRRWLGL